MRLPREESESNPRPSSLWPPLVIGRRRELFLGHEVREAAEAVPLLPLHPAAAAVRVAALGLPVQGPATDKNRKSTARNSFIRAGLIP